ncbi:MAG: stage III sporulation protein AB, partial [Oscillospiraceae bacterium]|nr:stage III sporulation protein AB [Oscillospiraceae bacterium]
MEEKKNETGRYLQAIACLPPRLMGDAMRISSRAMELAEEVRLRCGQPLAVIVDGEELVCEGEPVEAAELRELLARAARYSVHSYEEDLCRGFLPLEGGHRLGLCGTLAKNHGAVVGFRAISSVCIRIAREFPGISEPVFSKICAGRCCKSTLIVAPPGIGKTTFLRDLIRLCSTNGFRVGVADERSELAALRGGIPQFALGPRTDVIEGTDKADAAMRLIRTMSPQIIAMDEITEERDLL